MVTKQSRKLDLVLRGGRVVDPANGVDGPRDVGVSGGKIAAVASSLKAGPGTKVIDVRGRLVMPGLIDTHAHVYEHVTGPFGVNPDLVGIRSGVTTVVDQGGASPLTFQGFRKFIVEPATTRVYSFVSIYLAGGLLGHRHVGLYGPHGIDVATTVKAIEENRDVIRGIKTHAEIGGYSRWGLEVLKLAKEASRGAGVPVYIHLGRLWPASEGDHTDPDSILPRLDLLDPGDVIAHPFTRHPGAFVSQQGQVQPLITEAVKRGVRIDVGRGYHFSLEKARAVLDQGLLPFTIGSDVHGFAPKSGKGPALAYSLHRAMTELLGLGVPVVEIVKMVTCNAAAFLRLDGELGSLSVGRAADISVIDLEAGEWTLRDGIGGELPVTRRFRPVLALRSGRLCRSDSPLLPELVAA
jgi:dihydroorotase